MKFIKKYGGEADSKAPYDSVSCDCKGCGGDIEAVKIVAITAVLLPAVPCVHERE
ncbi:hypothetical protein [Eubacterium ramulus]|uniref:hypothetical protein n=1 Tax=Eubacterium ramulus TaxID=39490 RepID=UPI00300F42C8